MNDQITPHPILESNFQSFDPLFAGLKFVVRGTGYQNPLQFLAKKIFKKKNGEYHNGKIYYKST